MSREFVILYAASKRTGPKDRIRYFQEFTMSSIAIMQPYLFPYIGYFQLLNSVDLFVLYDDVQYIKGGWINRNKIFDKNGDSYLTFPVKKDSTYLNINQRYFSIMTEPEKNKILRRIEATYRDAPYFDVVSSIIERFLSHENKNVAEAIYFSLETIQQYLGLAFNCVFSSQLPESQGPKGLERVLRICKILDANVYINSPGGQSLYSKEEFQDHGISLHFIKPGPISYKQSTPEFVPNLSMIDVLAFNSIEETRQLIKQYSLI